MAENALMAKKTTKTDEPSKDRHKPSRMIRIRERIALQAEAFAESRETDLTQAVNELLIVALETKGLWPPSLKKPSS